MLSYNQSNHQTAISVFFLIQHIKGESQVRFVNNRIDIFWEFWDVPLIFSNIACQFFSSFVRSDSILAWVKIETSLSIWPSWIKSSFSLLNDLNPYRNIYVHRMVNNITVDFFLFLTSLHSKDSVRGQGEYVFEL